LSVIRPPSPTKIGGHRQPVRNVADLHEIPNHHLIPLNEREPCRKSRCFFFELKDVSAGAVDKNAPRPSRVVRPANIPAPVQVAEAAIRR